MPEDDSESPAEHELSHASLPPATAIAGARTALAGRRSSLYQEPTRPPIEPSGSGPKAWNITDGKRRPRKKWPELDWASTGQQNSDGR